MKKINWKKYTKMAVLEIGGVTALSQKLGVHRNSIYGWISGRCSPSTGPALKIIEILKNVEVEE